jgi:transglutaminase-like putative cysteine protease
MRCFAILGFTAVLLAGICSPPRLHAQFQEPAFQEPTRDELQMTADPKAPGAAAVYLYREDVTDKMARTRSFYERIKVLTEKGKELATVQLPYDPAYEKVDVVGRTIHADGTALPLVDKPSDIVNVKTKGFELDTLIFTLPGVEVGSILEYRVTVKTPRFPEEPTWMIQQDYFVHKAHYSYKTVKLLMPSFASVIGSDAKVVEDGKGLYTLDLTDVPALPNYDWMPPLNTIQWRVRFFHSVYPTPQLFWDQAGRSWAIFVNEFTKTTGSLKSAAAGMVAPSDSETEKAQKIYAAVMKLENTDFTREKSHVERKKEKIKDIHNAQDVWRDQSGSSDEIALLYVALCRAAGLDVDPMRIVDRSRAIFDPGLMSARQMDDYIAVGKLDGKEVFLDPGEKMCPFGMLHWKHTLTSGFRPAANGAAIVRTPTGDDKSTSLDRVADLTIDETGNVQGSVRVILSGQNALRWRQAAILSDEAEVKKKFNEWMSEYLPEGVQGDFDHFLGLDQYDSNLLGMVRVSGSLGTVTGKHMFLPGLFFESKARHPFVAEEKRTISVDVEYARTESDDVTYRLPAAYKMESGPQPTSVEWPSHARLAIATALDGDGVNVTRSLASSYAIVDPKDYEKLHEFYQKLATVDQQQIVLARSQPGKGN